MMCRRLITLISFAVLVSGVQAAVLQITPTSAGAGCGGYRQLR